MFLEWGGIVVEDSFTRKAEGILGVCFTCSRHRFSSQNSWLSGLFRGGDHNLFGVRRLFNFWNKSL